jgi:superfamily II DNA or RNA helicase
MNLVDIEIKDEYRSLLHDVTKEFYVPLLSVSTSYKRAVGFFSSTVLSQIADGIAALANNGGKVQIVASPYLSDEDVEAIKPGYEWRKVVRQAVLRDMQEAKNDFEAKRLNLLANLIADDILDVKIAFTESGSRMGMYHEKMGIISDGGGNAVAFSGSMNESITALRDNYEVIDVWCSWKSEEQKNKVDAKITAFTSIWNDTEPNIRIVDFPELKQEILDKYKRAPVASYEQEAVEEQDHLTSDESGASNVPEMPSGVSLHDYQNEAIEAWAEKQYCGIFDMATGTGKTFTGLGAITRLYQVVNGKLAVIIVCPYQHLVEQWIDDIELFGITPIIGYSASRQKDWLKRLEKAILNQKLKVKRREFFCFVCTNATFATNKVQVQLNKIHGNALLLVDEAHNFGAERLSNLMSDRYNFRLALSATIDRHNDEEGTAKLYDFFGEKCIEYTLERAIDEGKLTRYKYHPIVTTLNDDEMSVYSALTYEMSKCLIKGKDGKFRLSEKGKMLALKRARLVAGIEDKLVKLKEAIVPYVSDKYILVYCGATTLMNDIQDYTDTSDDDIRQIDAVTELLGNQLNMKVSQFTSKEDIVERERLKREFADGTNLQVLIAIKCLDEGVNIPAIKTAFLLASTTNPKEYIQRRGRVLRLSKDKDYAVIYDFIALPRPLGEVAYLTAEQMRRELTLVRNELLRAKEFARIAMNMAEAEQIIESVKNAYSIDDFAIDKEEDYYG